MGRSTTQKRQPQARESKDRLHGADVALAVERPVQAALIGGQRLVPQPFTPFGITSIAVLGGMGSRVSAGPP